MRAAKGDAAAAHSAAIAIAGITGGRVQQAGPNRGGYSAVIAVPYANFDGEALETALKASRFASSTGLGLKAITREKLSIDSPGRGFARRKDWGRAFRPNQLIPALYGFGQQIAAIEAYGGQILRIEIHVISPPVGRSVLGWSIV